MLIILHSNVKPIRLMIGDASKEGSLGARIGIVNDGRVPKGYIVGRQAALTPLELLTLQRCCVAETDYRRDYGHQMRCRGAKEHLLEGMLDVSRGNIEPVLRWQLVRVAPEVLVAHPPPLARVRIACV